MAIKWTNQLVLNVIEEARIAGYIAATKRLVELQSQGAKFAIMDGERIAGTMLDVCGFASLKISARGKFFQLAKKLAINPSARFFCVNGYYGGGSLSIFDSTNQIEMSINIAACQGQAKVLEGYGIKCQIQSRID